MLSLAPGCPRETALPICPPQHHVDSPRSVRIAALAGVDATLCFGATAPSEVSSDGIMRIDDRLGDVEAAARVAHLMSHVREPVHAALACDAFVEATLRSEARAFSIEVRERVRLRLTNAVVELPFERDATEEGVLSWLRSHPNGELGVRAVAADARALCRSRRSR